MSDRKIAFSYEYLHPDYINRHTYFIDDNGGFLLRAIDGQTGKELENSIPKDAALDHIARVLQKLPDHPQYKVLTPPTEEILDELDRRAEEDLGR